MNDMEHISGLFSTQHNRVKQSRKSRKTLIHAHNTGNKEEEETNS